MKNFDFSTYLSTFTWKYGSEEMRYIFSEENKLKLWRKVWVALAKAQNKAGLVSKQELDDLIVHEGKIDINRVQELEKEIHHDVMGAVKEFAEKAKIGGGKIHLGATSMDIAENADMIRIKEAGRIIRKKLADLLTEFSNQIKKYANLPCIGFTHLQTAEPTTVGYRLSMYAQDLLNDLLLLQFCLSNIKGKGMKGAVGTSAGYSALLKGKKINEGKLDEMVMKYLGVESVLIASQTYPRKFDFWVLTTLAGISQSLYKFAADLRILQSPLIGEWMEPFGKKQVGSSAMPFKRNPIDSERICGLARYVSHLPVIAWENAAHSYLERTLDDYIANRRTILAEGFLAVDEMLIDTQKIIANIVINETRIKHNLKLYGPFAATEPILMEAVKNGVNRQELHEILRDISMTAWQKTEEGNTNPMEKLLMNNSYLRKYLKKEEINKLLDVKNYIGNAPERALKLVKIINSIN